MSEIPPGPWTYDRRRGIVEDANGAEVIVAAGPKPKVEFEPSAQAAILKAPEMAALLRRYHDDFNGTTDNQFLIEDEARALLAEIGE